MLMVGTNDPSLSVHLKAFIQTGERLVVGVVGEGSSREVSSLWESPFENDTAGSYFSKIGGMVQAGALEGIGVDNLTGKTSKTTLNTTQVWSGTTPHTFNIMLELYAVSDPYTEVLAAIIELEKAAAPELNEKMPVGRTPGVVSLNVGRQIIYPECVITNVSKQLDGPISRWGYPLQAQVTLTLQTLTTVNQTDIPTTFG